LKRFIVRLSQSAALRHVKALQESGLITGSTIVFDENKAGFPSTTFVFVTLDEQKHWTASRLQSRYSTLPL
jgi:Lrp/AsnC family transcriptional regulator, leucine-responsive regulatory protein